MPFDPFVTTFVETFIALVHGCGCHLLHNKILVKSVSHNVERGSVIINVKGL